MASTPKPQDFSFELVNGNVKAAMSAAGAVSSDNWKVPRAAIRVIPGLNPRNADDPDYQAHIRFLADSIKANGFYENKPLTGFVSRENGENIINVTDGHSRLAAFDIAVSEGFQGETLPFVVKPRGTNLEDITIALVTDNSGKAFTPFELSIVCKRLVGAGMAESDIARRLGKTVTYIRDLLDLQAAPASVRQMVATGQVSASTARKTVKTHGAKAPQVLEKAAQAAKAKGKSKVTEKHVRAATGADQATTPTASSSVAIAPLDMHEFLRELQRFSTRAHGPGAQTEQLVADITDLLNDLVFSPSGASWICVAVMALDGALRCGATIDQILAALKDHPSAFEMMKGLRADSTGSRQAAAASTPEVSIAGERA